MYQSFDKFLRGEIPDFYLCNPDETIISRGVIPAKDRRCSLKFNDISEISFQVDDSYLDYDKIKARRLVFVDNIGYFQIQTVQEHDNGAEKYKEVAAYSLQNEFTTRRADIDNGTYRLYNNTDPSDTTTLLGILAPKIIGWTISEVDADLWDIYRTFDDLQSDISLYNFLVDSVSNAYECIVVFDFLNKEISFKVAENVTKPTSIYLSFQNLLNNMTVTEDSDEIKTVLYCYGQDLDISEVNPLGTRYIVNLDYYANSDWMSPDLVLAYNDWKTKLDLAHTNYVDLRASENDVITSMVPLQTEYQVMVSNRDIKENARIVGLAKGIDVSDIIAEIAILDGQISSKNAEIASKQGELDTLRSNINNIIDSVSLESNFTENQLSVLKRYFIEDSYTNENIIVTDTMTFTDIQSRAQTLFDQSKEILARISQPRYTFEADSENFLQIKEFRQFTADLELGCILNVEKDESVIYPILLQIDFNWDDPNDFTLTFGNRYSLNDAAYTFADLSSESIRTAQSVTAGWAKLNQYNADKNEIHSFINSALDASRNSIISSANQEMVIDASGLTAREWIEDTQTYDDEQLKIINNMIVFTDDKWNTVRTALGKISTIEDGIITHHGYGISGEVILGKLIAGSSLKIINSNNKFLLDENGATLIDATFSIENSTNKLLIDPANGFRYQKKSGSGYNDIITTNSNGDLILTGSITATSGYIGGLSGWVINGGYISSTKSGYGSFYISSAGQTSGTGNGNWITATNTSGTTIFSVSKSGAMTATSGTIGGWSINPTYLGSSQTGGSFYIAGPGDSSPYWIRAHNAAGGGGSMTFSVSKTGNIHASAGAIAGFNISTNSIYKTNSYYSGGVLHQDHISMNIPSATSSPYFEMSRQVGSTHLMRTRINAGYIEIHEQELSGQPDHTLFFYSYTTGSGTYTYEVYLDVFTHEIKVRSL